MDFAALLAIAVLAAAALRRVGGDALRALYEECGAKVMALAYRILRDRAEAEDVVQETFLELYRRADAYDERRGTRATWAVVIARSRAIDRLRARRSGLRLVEEQSQEPVPVHVEDPGDLGERRRRVQGALAELPAEQREAIELAYFEGLTHSEIAARTGQPLGTTKTRVRLAMQKLSARLAGLEEAAS